VSHLGYGESVIQPERACSCAWLNMDSSREDIRNSMQRNLQLRRDAARGQQGRAERHGNSLRLGLSVAQYLDGLFAENE